MRDGTGEDTPEPDAARAPPMRAAAATSYRGARDAPPLPAAIQGEGDGKLVAQGAGTLRIPA